MPIKLVLRIILATSFAVLAIIFTELLPTIPKFNEIVLRVVITALSALVGFIIFPDIATAMTKITLSFFNLTVARISSEVLNQLIKFPRQAHLPLGHPPVQVGGISLNKPLILDTSAIIDGRILEVAKTGFIGGLLLVPSFVLLELQQVADSTDNLKRARGRRGFEIVEELKKVKGVKVEIWDKDSGGKTVDEKLIKLAKGLHGKILTVDFNLNRLSTAQGVEVLNLNDLANAIKTQVLPGEKIEVQVVHIGKDPTQGIGYLDDGTMIVVEGAASYLGKTVDVEIQRVLQGSAGKMIFGKKR